MLIENISGISKQKVIASEKGFTLIEVIAVLLIVGIMATLGGMGIVQAVKGYMTVKENAAITQKAQLAMSRITREIQEMMSIAPGTAGGQSEILRMVGTANCLSSGDCVRSIGRPASGSASAVRNSLRIIFGNGALPSGDILIDNVTGFQFTYYSGNVISNSWAPGDDIHLSGIGVNMTVTNTNGQPLHFRSLVNPRNNGNLGGANMPVGTPPGTPAVWNVSNCFVATAAYGDATHPMVQILRDFRDNQLTHWPGGKAVVDFYYQHGPKAADAIRNRPVAMWAMRFLLAPVVAFAFCMLYAPLALPAILGAAIILTMALISFVSRKQARVSAVMRSRGSILVGIIITMVVIAVLAAAMLPIFSSSFMNQVHADQGRKAYFLAESGYSYATGRFLWAGTDSARDAVINDLNGKTCNLLNNAGSFTTQVSPFWLKVNTLTINTDTLTASYMASLPDELKSSCSGSPCGYLQVGGDFYSYTGRSIGSGSVTFTGLSPAATKTYPAGQIVLPVVKTRGSSQNLNASGGDLRLSGDGYNVLPEYNGIFSFQPTPSGLASSTVQFNYKYRKNDTLYNITRADKKPWTSLNVAAGTNIILERFVRISSTGTTVGGAVRKVDYDTSLSWLYGGGGFHPVEDQIGDTATDLVFKSDKNTVGDTIIVTGMDVRATLGNLGFPGLLGFIDRFIGFFVDVIDTIRDWFIGGCDNPNPQVNFVGANVTQLNVNPAQSWLDAQGFLSYDIQVKVEANAQQHFFAGPTFRGRVATVGGDQVFSSYGVSFAKARRYLHSGLVGCTPCFTDDQIGGFFPGVYKNPLWQWCDGLEIGNTCTPGSGCTPCGGAGSTCCTQSPQRGIARDFSLPAIILWKIDPTNGRPSMLAYRILTTDDGIVTYNSSTDEWRLNPDYSTLLVRVAEGYEITFTSGSSEIKKNDIISNSDGTRRARVVMAPILTSGSWASSNAAGKLVVANVNNGSTGATFSGALYAGGAQVASATGFDPTKRNYIRVYFSHPGPTDKGTPNNVETDNNRHANQVNSHNWPPDNLSELAAGNDYYTLVQWTGTAAYTQGTVVSLSMNSNWNFEKKHSIFGIPYSYWHYSILGGIAVDIDNNEEYATYVPQLDVQAGVTYDVTINFGWDLGIPFDGLNVYFGCQREFVPPQVFDLFGGSYTMSFKAPTTGKIDFKLRPEDAASFRITGITVTPRSNGAMASTSEPQAIIRDSSLTSPTPTNGCMTNDPTQFTCTASDFVFGTNYGDSFGLLTIGSTGPNISYDDWWIRMEEKKGTSLYPPIQH